MRTRKRCDISPGTKKKLYNNLIHRTVFKVARSGWVTIPFNFEQLVYHSEQSNRKSIITAVLEKHESFKWGKFHWNRSYHSNVMTSFPIFHERQLLDIKDNSWKRSTGSSTWHICIHVCKILRISMRAFSRNFRVKFLGVKKQQKQNNSELLLKSMSPTTWWNNILVQTEFYIIQLLCGKISGKSFHSISRNVGLNMN